MGFLIVENSKFTRSSSPDKANIDGAGGKGAAGGGAPAGESVDEIREAAILNKRMTRQAIMHLLEKQMGKESDSALSAAEFDELSQGVASEFSQILGPAGQEKDSFGKMESRQLSSMQKQVFAAR